MTVFRPILSLCNRLVGETDCAYTWLITLLFPGVSCCRIRRDTKKPLRVTIELLVIDPTCRVSNHDNTPNSEGSYYLSLNVNFYETSFK